MAIAAQVAVEDRRYSGWIDPRFPIGYWQAALALTGDATGGTFGIDLLFQPADPPRLNSQLYSVERFTVLSNETGNRVVRIGAVNMGGPSNLGFSHQYALTISTIGSTVAAALAGNMLTMIPWFLGSQRTAGISASLSLFTENVNGLTFTIEAEGYRWSPRSVLVDGGPQRPPTGPYGA